MTATYHDQDYPSFIKTNVLISNNKHDIRYRNTINSTSCNNILCDGNSYTVIITIMKMEAWCCDSMCDGNSYIVILTIMKMETCVMWR